MGAEIALPRVDSPFLRTGTGEFRFEANNVIVVRVARREGVRLRESVAVLSETRSLARICRFGRGAVAELLKVTRAHGFQLAPQ